MNTQTHFSKGQYTIDVNRKISEDQYLRAKFWKDNKDVFDLTSKIVMKDFVVKQKDDYVKVQKWFPLSNTNYTLWSGYRLFDFKDMLLGLKYTDENYQISNIVDLS